MDDHARRLFEELPDSLAKRLKGDRPLLNRLGLSTEKQVDDFAKRQVRRIKSLGVTSQDVELMTETARKHLPKDITEKWTQKNQAALKIKKMIN